MASRMSADLQRSLLETEGVVFLTDGRINMDECCWFDIENSLPPL